MKCCIHTFHIIQYAETNGIVYMIIIIINMIQIWLMITMTRCNWKWLVILSFVRLCSCPFSDIYISTSLRHQHLFKTWYFTHCISLEHHLRLCNNLYISLHYSTIIYHWMWVSAMEEESPRPFLGKEKKTRGVGNFRRGPSLNIKIFYRDISDIGISNA